MVNGSTWYSLTERELSIINKVTTSDEWKSLPMTTLLYYSVLLKTGRARVEQQLAIAPLAIQNVLVDYLEHINKALGLMCEFIVGAPRTIELETPEEMQSHPYVKVLKDFLAKGLSEERALKSTAVSIGMPETRLKQFLKDNEITFVSANADAVTSGHTLASENAGLDSSGIITLAKQYGYTDYLDVIDFTDGYLSDD